MSYHVKNCFMQYSTCSCFNAVKISVVRVLQQIRLDRHTPCTHKVLCREVRTY